MRDHTRNVFISVFGIAAVVVAMGFGARAIVREVRDRIPERPRGEDREVTRTVDSSERAYEYRDFTSVESRGAWEVELTQGPSYTVTVTAPADAWDKIEVRARRETLVLDIDRPINLGDGKVVARITTPELSRVATVGGAKILLADFQSEELRLDIDGAASIEARDVTVGRLDVDSDGASRIDFSEGRVENAEIRLDGAGLVKIVMAGGRLGGRIAGLGRVEYSGEIASQEIEVSGLSQVRRAD